MAKKKEDETTPQADAEVKADAEVVEEDYDPKLAEKKKLKRKRGRRVGHKNGKKIQDARNKSAKEKVTLPEAFKKLMEIAPKRKFDEAIEITMKLGIDPKKQGQALRGAISLPHGVGKTNRVICFAEGPAADEALAAGAVEVGSDALGKKIQDGWDDFDVCIAHPTMMRIVGKLGRVLGPKGKMPTPKNGTVTPNLESTIKEFVAGKIEYRADEFGNVHAVVGKRSFEQTALLENTEYFIEHIKTVKPAEAKGTYIQRIYISTTMGPSVPVTISDGGK